MKGNQVQQISETNYEAYLIDYFENKLDAFQSKCLFDFLKLNQIEILLEHDPTKTGIKSLKKENRDLSFYTDDLKKYKPSYKETLVLFNYLENNLDNNKVNEVEKWLEKDDILNEHYNYLKGTILKPDLSKIYSNKAKLKGKQTGSVIWRNKSLQVAATILIFIFSTSLFFNNKSKPNLATYSNIGSKSENLKSSESLNYKAEIASQVQPNVKNKLTNRNDKKLIYASHINVQHVKMKPMPASISLIKDLIETEKPSLTTSQDIHFSNQDLEKMSNVILLANLPKHEASVVSKQPSMILKYRDFNKDNKKNTTITDNPNGESNGLLAFVIDKIEEEKVKLRSNTEHFIDDFGENFASSNGEKVFEFEKNKENSSKIEAIRLRFGNLTIEKNF